MPHKLDAAAVWYFSIEQLSIPQHRIPQPPSLSVIFKSLFLRRDSCYAGKDSTQLAFVCALMQRLSCLFTHKFAANTTHRDCGDSGMHSQSHTEPRDSDTLALGWSNLLANALYILHTLIQFNGRINLAHLLHFKTRTHSHIMYEHPHSYVDRLAHRCTDTQIHRYTDAQIHIHVQGAAGNRRILCSLCCRRGRLKHLPTANKVALS